MQTPKQILAEIKMKNAIKKAEEQREKEIENFAQKGFSSKEDYADFLDKRDRIQASKSGAMSGKKVAIAGVVAAAGIGAGLYAINNMDGGSNQENTPEDNYIYPPDHSVPPVEPTEPASPDVDPDDFEEVVNNPSYQEQVSEIYQKAQEAISGLEDGFSEQTEKLYNQIVEIEQANGINDYNIFNSSTGYVGVINDYVRLDNESTMEFLIRIRNDELHRKEEYIDEYVNYITDEFPQLQEFFRDHGLTFDYDTWQMLENLPSGSYTESGDPLEFHYIQFAMEYNDELNLINNSEYANQIVQNEAEIGLLDRYLDNAYNLMSESEKESIEQISDQLFDLEDNITEQANEIWAQYMQELEELQMSYLQEAGVDLSTFAGLPEVQADDLGVGDNLNEFANIKTNILAQKAGESVDTSVLGDGAVNKSILSDLDLSSGMDAVQDSVLGSDLAPYLAAGAVVAGAAVVAGLKLHEKAKEKKAKTEEEQTL